MTASADPMTDRMTDPTPNSTMPRVLLTGFEAFGDSRHSSAELNPSWQAVQSLDGDRLAGHRVVAARLPCVFGASLTVLRALLQQHRPNLVIAVGEAGGRSALSLERIAINLDDAPMPDNVGVQPVDQSVEATGPAAYFSSLPIKAMLHDLHQAGLPAEISSSAGSYVCNHVFYGLMHSLSQEPTLRGCLGGFLHVPYLPEQGTPSLPLSDTSAGLRLMLTTALRHRAALERGAETRP